MVKAVLSREGSNLKLEVETDGGWTSFSVPVIGHIELFARKNGRYWPIGQAELDTIINPPKKRLHKLGHPSEDRDYR